MFNCGLEGKVHSRGAADLHYENQNSNKINKK
jgi:hypothetical protein